MRFMHRAGEGAPSAISLSAVRDKAAIDNDGVFEVDESRADFVEIYESLVAAGHEPFEEPPADSADTTADDDLLKASDFSEEELVGMGYNDLRAIAAEYDDIDGNDSQDALLEALIKQRRKETEDD